MVDNSVDKKNSIDISTEKKMLSGRVVSDKMNKTIVVEMDRRFKHKQYNKILRRTKRYQVHDENSQARTNDIVEFFQGRPKSKNKYMYLSRVVKSAAI
jgi:small subunit ribosomal protein S17